MSLTVSIKYSRISPKKLKDIASKLTKKRAIEAMADLSVTYSKAAILLKKVIKSAISNAENNHKLNSDNLYIDKIEVTKGPAFKRWRAVSRGTAHQYKKRTSNIRLTLIEKLKIKKEKGEEKKTNRVIKERSKSGSKN